MATDHSGVELQTQPVCTTCECGKIYDVIVHSVDNGALTEQNDPNLTTADLELAPKSTAEAILANLHEDSFFHWSPHTITMLIEQYKENHDLFFSPSMKKKKAWDVVAHRMAHKGVAVSWQQCESKWKNLNRNYRKIQNDITTHGNTSAARWPFFKDMEEISNMRSDDVMDSASGEQGRESPPSASELGSVTSISGVMASNGVDSAGSSQRGKKRRADEEPAWFRSYRVEVQRRHEQRMTLQKQIMEQHKLLTRQLIKVLDGLKK